MVSLVAMFGFYLLTFSWPFLPSAVQIFHQNGKLNSMLLTLFSDSSIEEQLGCNASKFSWCYDLKQVSVVVFFVSYIAIIGVTFPNINIALNTLFSKIIGPRRQGN
jgi:hypothetical protein